MNQKWNVSNFFDIYSVTIEHYLFIIYIYLYFYLFISYYQICLIYNLITALVDVKWTLPLIKKFIQTLLSITLSDNIQELKDATLPKPVWQKMEKKLNIHENVLRTFWQHQLHLQLFSTCPIYLNDIKIQLIE